MSSFDLSTIWNEDNDETLDPEAMLIQVGQSDFKIIFDKADQYYQSLPYDGDDEQARDEYILESWLDNADDLMDDLFYNEDGLAQ
jgi:hypothetical protein